MHSKRLAGACMSLMLMALAARSNAAAEATSAADSSTELQEVVVTAEKRSENLQKAPTTISVATGDELVTRGVDDISEATAVFPSVKFGQISGTVHLYIRGIGAEQDRASIDPLSAMTENGIVLPREVTGNNLFDVSAIEVLPGPQSTLYSTSAAGGIVTVVDNRPTKTQEGSLMFETGNYDLKHVTVVENMPLSDTLSVRAAFDSANHDGYQTSGADAEDELGARISALYQPNSDFTGYAWYAYNHTGGQPANTVTLTGNHQFADPKNPWNDYSCAPSGAGAPLGANPTCDPFYIGQQSQDFRTNIFGGQFDWHIQGATLSMIPGALVDSGTTLQYFSPFPNYQVIANHQYSDEFRITSDSEKPFKWVGGLYWYQSREYQYFSVNNTLEQNLTQTDGNPQLWNEDKTYAAFGQVTYSITDTFRVTGGLRYSSNQKDANGCNCSAGGGEGVYFTFNHTWPRVDWKAGLEADIGSNGMWYATVQTGYNNGAYQYYNTSGLLGKENSGPAPLVEPSTLTSYSTGTKFRFFDNRLEVNNEIYFYDYKNLLIAPFDDNPAHYGNTFYNADKTEIYGDELDVKYLLTPSDQLQMNFNYNHARAIDFIVGEPPVNYGGLQLIEAPDVVADLGYRHTWAVPGGASVELNGDSHYENGFWGTFNHAPTTHQPAFTRTDANLTYKSQDGKWDVGLWGKNLENSAVIGPGAYVGAGTIGGVYWLLPPRTYGVRFGLKW
ncbi:MAG: TonB-dependent receptor [Steroidobacteraceae bacterium]